MSKSVNNVEIQVHGFRYGTWKREFTLGKDIAPKIRGLLGPKGIDSLAADLLNLGMAVYHIEHQLNRFNGNNPPRLFALEIEMGNLAAWDDVAQKYVADILTFMANDEAHWEISLTAGHKVVPTHKTYVDGHRDSVALFSGGLDSTSGLATIHENAPNIQPVTFYTNQWSVQNRLLKQFNDLGVQFPDLVGITYHRERKGSGYTALYRSFLFLILASVVARSWDVHKIYQFENGILGLAIPPQPSSWITKHAHPTLHRMFEKLLNHLFGGEWAIVNPFKLKTKREVYLDAIHALNYEEDILAPFFQQTQTCWYYFSPSTPFGSKKPNTSCGACTPCLIRRTALQDPSNNYVWDLTRDEVRDDPEGKMQNEFLSYYLFLKHILSTHDNPSEFLLTLPSHIRELFLEEDYGVKDIHEMFLRFAVEFATSFKVDYGLKICSHPALSIQQPWAELILQGKKSVELRRWTTDYRGDIWVHVGQKYNEGVVEYFQLDRPLQTGGVIGRVVIDNVVQMTPNLWSEWRNKHLDLGDYQPGFYGFLLSAPQRLGKIVPVAGKLKLFSLPAHICYEIEKDV